MRKFKIHCSQIGKIMGESKPKGGLSQTCKTFLHEWYADEKQYIHSKYTDKGNIVEFDLISFMADVLGYGMAEKNEVTKEDEYMIGTCDVDLPSCIVDVKAPWDKKSLHDHAMLPIDKDYEWQGHGYMHLYGKQEFILFYGLMDTPADLVYSEQDVIYSDLPPNERWCAQKVSYDQSKIEDIIKKVEQCRTYLAEYDKQLRSKLGIVSGEKDFG